MEYYKSRLEEKEQEYYYHILDALKIQSDLVKAPAWMAPERVRTCIEAVWRDHPELFYVEFHTLSHRDLSDGVEYLPDYKYDPEEIRRRQEWIEEQTGLIITRMEQAGAKSIYQKCGWLHNYLVRHCTYDDEAVERPGERRSAYCMEGVFREQKAVCQGIAMAYQYLCQKAGVEVLMARGVSLQPGCREFVRHAWNIVCAGEAAAHVDVTWDICMSSMGEGVRYDYFFLPDLEMMRDHQYVGYPVCGPLRSSYFERTGRLFRDLEELKAYVRAEFDRSNQGEKEVRLQFKMKDRKVTRDELRETIVGVIRQCTCRGFTFTCNYNMNQLVFQYQILFQ